MVTQPDRRRVMSARATHDEELVHTFSDDGILLTGAVIRPSAEPLDRVIVYVHGCPISSFVPLAWRLGRHVSARGYPFIAANTRGHDVGTYLFTRDGSARLGGSWWELFEDHTHDLGAWLAFAERSGLGRAVLMGFSFGALKVVSFQAQRDDPRVAGIVVAGGPVRAPGRSNIPSRLNAERAALAQRMVEEGRGTDLLPWETPGEITPGMVSAQTYLSWWRDGLDVFGTEGAEPPIAAIRCPILLCYGTEEPEIATAEDVEAIRGRAKASSKVDVRLVEGSGHGFVGHEREVAGVITDWLDTIP
jgi:dienelactone hydrolase